MSEQHDIVLKLNIDDFQRGIDQARIHLTGLEHSVNAIGQNIGKVINGIKLDNLNFTQASTTAKTFSDNLKTVQNDLKNINKTVDNVKNKVVKAFDFGTELGNNLQKGIEVGLAHAVGAISIGANPLTALPHELIRNVGISVFHTLTQAYKATGEAAKAATPSIEGATGALNTNAEGAVRSSDALRNLANQGSALSQIFTIVKTNFRDLVTGAGLLLLGKLLDGIGDKLLGFAESLAKISGEANLSFIQLNAVLETTSQNLGVSLGTTKEWEKFIIQLSSTSGTSRKELADFATAFVQIGADAGLSGEELQKLVTIAAFTKDRFRNATEQLTNFRQALAGNVRFLQNNIPIGTTLNDVTEKYAEALQRAGHSQEEATKLAKEATVAKRVLVALDEASIPFVKTATETTGSYTIELRKLNAAIANLQISLGSGIEGAFAGATKVLRRFIEGIVSLPQPIQTVITYSITLIGVLAEVGAKVLKLTGAVILLTTAYKILNAAIFITIPALGTSLAGWAAMSLAVVGPIQPITTLSGLLVGFGSRLVALVTPLLSLSGLLNTIGAAFTRLGAFLGPIIVRLATLANILALLKFGAIITGVIALAEGFSKAFSDLSKINSGIGLGTTSLRGLTDALGITSGAVNDLSESFNISQRAAGAWTAVINTAALAVKGLALLASLATQSILEESIALTQHKLIDAVRKKDTKAEAELRDQLDQKQKALQRNAEAFDALVISTKKSSQELINGAKAVVSTNTELNALTRELADADLGLVAFSNTLQGHFNPAQFKILENGIRGFRRELIGLKAKQAELTGGPAAGKAIRDLEIARELALEVNKATEKGGGIKLDEDQINNAKTVQEIFNAIRVGSPELAKQLEDAFKPLGPKQAAIEGLERQKKLFSEIITSVNSLKDAFTKELNTLTSTVDLQNQFNDAISKNPAKDNFEALVKNAQLENDIRKATLDIENKIQDIRDKIAHGKLEVQATGQTISVRLSPQEKAKATADLNKLTKDKDAIINLKVNEVTAKRTGEIISELQKQIESLGKFFEDNLKSIQDENILLQLFNINLSQGSKFAEEQNVLATKRLALSNKIVDAEKELVKIDKEITDLGDKATPQDKARLDTIRARAIATIENARAQREVNSALEETNQNIKKQQELHLSLIKQKEALQDQLALISIRAELFKENVLVGEFNQTKEQIQAITGELENLFKKKIELQRQAQESGDNGLISSKDFEETIKRINDFKEVLKNLNIRETIREALQAIPDELQKAFTTGFREVLAGTKKITDLLRETASNILNNISDIFAKKAFDKIRNGLDEVANQIADSDIFKSISNFFGIDIGKGIKDIFGGAAKLGTPTEQLNQSTQELDTTNKSLIETIKELITALGGTGKPKPSTATGATGQPSGIIPTTTNLPIGIAAAPPPIDFEGLAKQVEDGTATLEVISETGINGWFEESTKALTNGFQTVIQSNDTGFSNFFSNLGTLLSDGLKSLVKGIGGLFSDEGGGGGIFGTIFKGILSIFSSGAAGGGLIPGQPSTKDNQVMPVASGEYVVNSEAVKAYGPKFFDALNNMSLPQDFFSNLQASGASAQLASVAPSISSAIGATQATQNERPIIVNVIDRAPKLDPAAFKMKPSEVTQIFVDGIRKDRITRRVIRDDLRNG